MLNNNETPDKALVTFALFAYNQENYIREAVEGAFAQTYSPLEIILSDDCSSDNTYEIMERMAEGYSGPHKVVLNCNEKNLGIIDHVNRVFQLSSSELIVMAAGDDISFPERVSQTYGLWEESGFEADGMSFNYDPFGSNPRKYFIDESHNTIESQIDLGGSKVYGSTAAWTKRLMKIFGPMPREGEWEDKVLSFRAALAGGMVCRDVPVIKYRMNNSFRVAGRALINSREIDLGRRKGHYQSFLCDLRTLKAQTEGRSAECTRYEKAIQKQLAKIHREEKLYSDSFCQRVLGLAALLCGLTWTRWPLRKKLSLAKLISLDIVGQLK